MSNLVYISVFCLFPTSFGIRRVKFEVEVEAEVANVCYLEEEGLLVRLLREGKKIVSGVLISLFHCQLSLVCLNHYREERGSPHHTALHLARWR